MRRWTRKTNVNITFLLPFPFSFLTLWLRKGKRLGKDVDILLLAGVYCRFLMHLVSDSNSQPEKEKVKL